MFNELLQILIVQLTLVSVIALWVSFVMPAMPSREHFQSSYFYLSNPYDRSGNNDNRAFQMNVERGNRGNESSRLDITLDNTVDNMRIMTSPISRNSSNRGNQQTQTLVDYDLQKQSISYNAPVSMKDLTVSGSINASRDLSIGNIQAKTVSLENGWALGTDSKTAGLAFRKGAINPVTINNNNVNVPGALASSSLTTGTINARDVIAAGNMSMGAISAKGDVNSGGNVNTQNVNVTANGGCIGRGGRKICFKDDAVESASMNLGSASINNAGMNWAAMNGASIGGIKVGSKVATDEKGENPKVLQTLDADYIELRNNVVLGKDNGEVRVGNFRLVEDKPGRLSIFWKQKRMAELDATGSRSTDFYLYNQDSTENYAYMSSSSKQITKNIREGDKEA